MTRQFALFFTAFLFLNIHSSKASGMQDEDLVKHQVKKLKSDEPSALNAVKWEELPHSILNRFLGKALMNDGAIIIRLSLTNKNVRNFIEQTCETLDLRGYDLSTDLFQLRSGKHTMVNLETFLNLKRLDVTGCNLSFLPILPTSVDPKKCIIIDDKDFIEDLNQLNISPRN